MEPEISDQLSALAHERRLDVFRLLMRRYPDAVPAGEIASALGLRANTASVYLSILRQAGLISQTRSGTFQLYRIRMETVQGMFDRMLGDCCRNRPDICMPALPQHAMPGGDTPLNVLFLCSHNSARSIMAEALLRDAGPGFRAFSAGTQPAGEPHPAALDMLTSHDVPTDGLTSLPIAQFLNGTPVMDLVITVCDRAANEDVVRWPGTPLHAHWGVDDPMACDSPALQRAAMAQAFSLIRARIDALTSLDMAGLDPADLQGHLDDIGRMHLQAAAQ
ncbi:MAG: ArsR family transcriptional regulator [Rhodobacteraceae bacterium]|nr:ArsR family transcriptional regulator [Paracoccaceae bacterium]